MERATCGIILPGFFELYVLIHHIDNIDTGKQLLNKVGRDHQDAIIEDMRI